jgi:glycosyltransferase involved in cell wall biosynthesis
VPPAGDSIVGEPDRDLADVGVVVPAYNAERFIAEALDSVLSQTVLPRRIVVVDDGSTDGTAAVLSHYSDVVQVLRVPNGGVARARNTGVAVLDTRWVAFIDADDVWLPSRLERTLSAAASADDPVLVYCGLLSTDADLRPRARLGVPDPAVAVRNTLLLEPPVVSVAQGGLVAREALVSVGGFDETMSTSADTDLVVRLGLIGRLVAVDDDLVLYRQHSNQMSADVDAMLRDMKRCYGKVFSTGALPPDLARLERRARANHRLAVGGELLRRGARRDAIPHHARAAALNPGRFWAVVVRRLRGGERP